MYQMFSQRIVDVTSEAETNLILLIFGQLIICECGIL